MTDYTRWSNTNNDPPIFRELARKNETGETLWEALSFHRTMDASLYGYPYDIKNPITVPHLRIEMENPSQERLEEVLAIADIPDYLIEDIRENMKKFRTGRVEECNIDLLCYVASGETYIREFLEIAGPKFSQRAVFQIDFREDMRIVVEQLCDEYGLSLLEERPLETHEIQEKKYGDLYLRARSAQRLRRAMGRGLGHPWFTPFSTRRKEHNLELGEPIRAIYDFKKH